MMRYYKFKNVSSVKNVHVDIYIYMLTSANEIKSKKFDFFQISDWLIGKTKLKAFVLIEFLKYRNIEKCTHYTPIK